MSESRAFIARRNITVPGLIALAVGFAAGLLARDTQWPALLELSKVVEPVGALWTGALRMVVLPLMVSYIVLAINAAPSSRSAGRLGVMSTISYVALLGAATAFSFMVGSQLMAILPIDDAAREAFRSLRGSGPSVVPDSATASTAKWVAQLIPSNPLRAASEDNYLGVVVSTVLFSLAMTRISPEKRKALAGLFEAIAETSGVLIGWIIWLLPIAAFALAYSIGTSSGLAAAGAIGWFVVGVSALLILCTLLLYPLTALLGRVSLARFARAVAPSQTVAAGTRSSLACLPPLLEGAERLELPTEVSGFVLPLSVSTFKINAGITQPFELMFLSSMFGLTMSPAFLVSFAVTTILISFTSAGVPSGGRLVSWPMYLAAGVPIQALVVVKVTDAIPDIFKTVANVTADLSVATIVARFFREEESTARVAAPIEAPESLASL